MKNKLFPHTRALAFAFVMLAAHQADAIVISFSNVTGARLAFNGTTDSFEFKDNTTFAGPGMGRDFSIGGSDGVGDSVGLLGNLGGVFTIGAISISGTQQSATVTGAGGTFSIFDGITSFMADVAWISIYTNGTGGGLNAGGSLNLTNVSYTGANADLIAIATATDRTASIGFNFVPAKTLTQLTANGATNTTSYNGSINGVPPLRVPEGGSALVMLGITLLSVETLRRRFSSKQ